jgi:hypothetical protein
MEKVDCLCLGASGRGQGLPVELDADLPASIAEAEVAFVVGASGGTLRLL